MLAGKIPTIYLKKVKGEKKTDMGQFDIDLFMWKERYTGWVKKAKHLEVVSKKL